MPITNFTDRQRLLNIGKPLPCREIKMQWGSP